MLCWRPAPSPEEPSDDIQIDQLLLLRILFDLAQDRRRDDLGAPGMEVVDWFNTVRCARPNLATALVHFVRTHQGLPFPELGKAKCDWSAVH